MADENELSPVEDSFSPTPGLNGAPVHCESFPNLLTFTFKFIFISSRVRCMSYSIPGFPQLTFPRPIEQNRIPVSHRSKRSMIPPWSEHSHLSKENILLTSIKILLQTHHFDSVDNWACRSRLHCNDTRCIRRRTR